MATSLAQDNTARSRVHDLRESAIHAGQKVREYANNTSDAISNVSHSMTDHIREKPVRSSLIALAAGCVIGLLIRR